MVQVRAIYSDEGISEWETQTFSTLEDVSQPEAINSIIANSQNANVWYRLDGLRLNQKPTAKGVYINNGRKVVMK